MSVPRRFRPQRHRHQHHVWSVHAYFIYLPYFKLNMHQFIFNSASNSTAKLAGHSDAVLITSLCPTRLPSNLKPTTRECVHLITCGHFRSRDKDVGHTIGFAIARYGWMLWLYRTGIMADRSFTFEEWEFSTSFCLCNLDVDPVTFIYEFDPYSLEIYRMCKYKLPTSRLSKVIV